MSTQSCANNGCDHVGTRKCSACSTVAYCGPICQKAHWSLHKKACKASKSQGTNGGEVTAAPQQRVVGQSPAFAAADRNNLPPQVTYELVQRLQAAKLDTQKAFNAGDFQASVKAGNEALQCARMLPEPGSSIESVQIHLNMSTAFLQLGKVSEAKIHSSLCVEIAERGLASRPNDSLAIEMLVVALGSRTFTLLHESDDNDDIAKANEAEVFAARSLSLAEKIYVSTDTKLFKPLRMLGLIRDKQGKYDDALDKLDKAYTIASQGYGPAHQESQLSMDDIIATLVKKATFHPDDFDKANEQAEKYARKNYDAVVRSEVEKDHLVVGDAAGRLATVLARAGKESDAEPLMRQSLAIREKHLGKMHPLVGVTLGFLAGILEGSENYGDEPEELLLRAIEIFKRAGGGSEGPHEGAGRHLHSATAHLQRIRMKRQGVFPSQPVELVNVSDDEDDDDDVEEVDVSKSAGDKVSVKPKPIATAAAKSTSTATAAAAAAKSGNNKNGMPKFESDDGIGRMKHAAYFYETQQFSRAEILLAEAFEIFLKENGPKHQSTMAAKQNLEVVRNQGLMLLWQEVAREEMAKLSLTAAATTPAAIAAGDDGPTVAAAGGVVAPVTVADDAADDITWCDGASQPILPEEEWLFKEPERKAGCIIC